MDKIDKTLYLFLEAMLQKESNDLLAKSKKPLYVKLIMFENTMK